MDARIQIERCVVYPSIFNNKLKVNKSVRNPIYIDVKEDRARNKGRRHVSRVQGGYLVARLVGTADLPIYRKVPLLLRPSTRDEPSGSMFVEKSRHQNKPDESDKKEPSNKASNEQIGLMIHKQPTMHQQHVKGIIDQFLSTIRHA